MEADRERMKTLLVEAIATLCRNGLKYTDELSVEGLIGITLDKKDVFLVSVRETYSLTSQFNQNGSESPQSQDSVGSEKVQKRSTKRSRENNGEGGPNEKHKRKGAPKKIGAHEAELINNSPAGDDLVDSLDDEDSSSFGSRIPRKREEEFVVIEDFEDDVPIKKETVISQGSDYMTSPETASSFAQMPSQNNPPKPVMASTHTVSRAPPPLHPRPDQVSPRAADQMDIRFQHPAGVSNDQLILAQDIKVEHDSDSSMSVYRSPSGEIIKVPRNINAESNIPVTVSVMAGVGGTQSVQGMHDTSGGPDDWATPSSSQEFITLPGSDSLQESPSQQAPGSSGASQQVLGLAPPLSQLSPSGGSVPQLSPGAALDKNKCPLCERFYCDKKGLRRHMEVVHFQMQTRFCPVCGVKVTRQDKLRRHMETVHYKMQAHICHICGVKVNRHDKLAKHMSKVHGLTMTGKPAEDQFGDAEGMPQLPVSTAAGPVMSIAKSDSNKPHTSSSTASSLPVKSAVPASIDSAGLEAGEIPRGPKKPGNAPHPPLDIGTDLQPPSMGPYLPVTPVTYGMPVFPGHLTPPAATGMSPYFSPAPTATTPRLYPAGGQGHPPQLSPRGEFGGFNTSPGHPPRNVGSQPVASAWTLPCSSQFPGTSTSNALAIPNIGVGQELQPGNPRPVFGVTTEGRVQGHPDLSPGPMYGAATGYKSPAPGQ